MSYDFEEERIAREILKLGAKRVLVQLPEGLKPEALRLAKTIEKAGALPIISADPCYGACDLCDMDAEDLGAELLIHFGHSKLVRHERVRTIHVHARATIPLDSVVEEALLLLQEWHTIGLATTIQHVEKLDSVRKRLTNAGKAVLIGDARRLSHPGQVTGCEYSNAKTIAENVEAFLFVGGGRFHALGIVLSTMKPTVVADPFQNRALILEKEEAYKIMRKRWADVQSAQKAETFAILVSLKAGQKRLEQALILKDKLEARRKTATIFAVREITPEMLYGFPEVDAYVNTACPRISIDDSSRFKKPILTINETLVTTGDSSWEDLCKKGLLEN